MIPLVEKKKQKKKKQLELAMQAKQMTQDTCFHGELLVMGPGSEYLCPSLNLIYPFFCFSSLSVVHCGLLPFIILFFH